MSRLRNLAPTNSQKFHLNTFKLSRDSDMRRSLKWYYSLRKKRKCWTIRIVKGWSLDLVAFLRHQWNFSLYRFSWVMMIFKVYTGCPKSNGRYSRGRFFRPDWDNHSFEEYFHALQCKLKTCEGIRWRPLKWTKRKNWITNNNCLFSIWRIDLLSFLRPIRTLRTAIIGKNKLSGFADTFRLGASPEGMKFYLLSLLEFTNFHEQWWDSRWQSSALS